VSAQSEFKSIDIPLTAVCCHALKLREQFEGQSIFSTSGFFEAQIANDHGAAKMGVTPSAST
jgi:hypothetical protein